MKNLLIFLALFGLECLPTIRRSTSCKGELSRENRRQTICLAGFPTMWAVWLRVTTGDAGRACGAKCQLAAQVRSWAEGQIESARRRRTEGTR